MKSGMIRSAEQRDNIKRGVKGKLKEYYKTHPHHMEGKILPTSWRTSISKGLIKHWETREHHQTGAPRPEAVRKKIGKTSKGHPNYLLRHPVSYFLKMQKYWKDPVWVENQSEKHRGKNCIWWKGGISNVPYPVQWRQSLKNTIKERDRFACKNPFCRDGSGFLQIHHIDFDKKNLSEDNLISLCRSCHAKTKNNRPFYTFLFQNALANFYRCQEANKIGRVA